MKLHSNDHGFEGCLPNNRIAMKIKSSAKMFEILSSGIYKDKILAVIREYSCNAFDAHITAGKRDVPFTIKLPNRFDSTFAVIDQGSGVEPHGHQVGDDVIPGPDADGNFEPHLNIGAIFWTYGESSKTKDNETIGALGLGSKSAFAYTKSSFIVKNRWNDVEYTYFCFINEKGEPEGSCVGEEPTTEGNGITVEFAVRPEDNHAFYERFGRIFKYWANVKPNILGVEHTDVFYPDPIKVIEGKGWYLEKKPDENNEGAIAIMGNVQYPIDSGSIPNLPAGLKIIANNPFIITFPLGALEFASSREDLSYSEFTCKAVIARLEEVRRGMEVSFKAKTFDASPDHVTLYHNFSSTFREFRDTVTVPSNNRYSSVSEETNNAYSQLLLGKDQDEEVVHLGRRFMIKHLINREYSSSFEKYQSFGMYVASTRGRSFSRYHLAPSTFLTFCLNQEMDSKAFDPLDRNSYALEVGHAVISGHDWRANYLSKRESKHGPTDFELGLKSLDKMTVTTDNIFKLPSNVKQVVFIVNDVGSSGRDRFRAIVESVKQLDELKLTEALKVFVDFNDKVTNAADVLDELKRTIDATLVGATIRTLSALPDARLPIVKAKTEKGSVKLTVRTYDFENIGSVDVANGIRDSKICLANVQGFSVRGATADVMMSIKELAARKGVAFIIKRRVRNKFFDDVESRREALVGNHELMSLANHLGMLNDLHSEVSRPKKISVVDEQGVKSELIQIIKVPVLPVLIINEGMHAHLAKKGVKLVSLSSYLGDQIKAMNEAEKFTEAVRRVMTLARVRHLRDMYSGLNSQSNKFPLAEITEGWGTSNSFFKKLFAEYLELREHGANFALIFAKLSVMTSLNIEDYVDYDNEAEKITNEIDAHYPMLEVTGYGNMYGTEKGKKIVAYIELIDKLVAKAVAGTEEHFHEEEHIW